MAKQSAARTKMLASQAKKAAAERRAEKVKNESVTTPSQADSDKYLELEGNWVAIGLAAPARRALIDDGLFSVSDLRKTSLAALKELDGMGPNAIRVLVAEMKKADLSFRK
jgi:hypothetical protein|uniref:hypothetical protein n=1 Tax=Candidatus Planktophila sp. TaxID=2175601 RepID=UPI0040496947